MTNTLAGPPSLTSEGALRRLGPGTVVAAAGTAVALGVHAAVPSLGALVVAVVMGALIGPILPAVSREGLLWVSRALLRLGVVVLGLQLGVDSVVRLGVDTVLAVVATVILGFAGTLGLGRLLGVPPGLRLLVATGFSICGASAIAAMDSVSGAKREEVATGIALVTLFGSVAIGVLPLTGSWLGLDDGQIGAWAGLSVHEVAQVVAAAAPAGAAAVSLAVVVKLTRVVLLAPMVVVVGIAQRRHGPVTGKRPPLVPLFVLGFLATGALRSTGVVPAEVLSASAGAATMLFTAALFALGTAVRVGDLLRTGRRGLLLGACSTVLMAAVGLTALLLAGTG